MANLINSPEFNRASGQAAETGLKYFFKGVEWVVKFIFDFLKQMSSQIFGR